MARYVLLIISALIVSGCSAQASVDQSKMCFYSSDKEAEKCTPGELAYFKPQSWGNEQLPLQAAVTYCDFNHPVMHTSAGVICVFTDKRLHLLK